MRDIRNRGHTVFAVIMLFFVLVLALTLSGPTTQASANSIGTDQQYVVMAATDTYCGKGMSMAVERMMETTIQK